MRKEISNSMDKSSSLERNSFNMAEGNPVAESTHLNGNSFSWGSMSRKHRSYSSFCLNNTYSDSNNKSIASPKTKNVTKIDARIAADVQSKGLASRIVKYHENGTRLNRSMSAHNLYSKPGQFPAVTLKKAELPYRATKQDLSIIRIPPPEKSSFYGNTISSLLRSTSVVGLQSKRTEELSRENRPIIHPPPTESDMAPTRSVLDVLKEISRKRINSDDLESEETSKKYCNRAGNDFVDTVNNSTSTIPQCFIASPLSCQRYKRQRDCITPHHGVQLPEIKTSPEQAKKRVCNYNNDITSSLSSSIKCKRISQSHIVNQTMPINLESYEIQKTKKLHYDYQENKNNTQVDVRFENLENTLRKVEAMIPITPIPETPYEQGQSNISGVVPKRTVSEPFYNSDPKIELNLTKPANKPRLTLFNKKYDENEGAAENESSELVAQNTDDLNELDNCAGIPFVKPKKIKSKSGLRNPVMERTQKSKLALMLSGLRGELYQNTDGDELDSAKERRQAIKENNINTNTSAVAPALKSANTITTSNTVTSSINAKNPNEPNLLNFSMNTTTTSSSPLSANTSANKTSSPLVGLKLTQPNLRSENVTNMLSVDATHSTETQSKPILPPLSGFPYSTANTNSPPMANTLSNGNLKGFTSTTTPVSSISTSSSNILNLGQSKQLTSSLTLDDKTNKLSVKKQPSTKNNLLQFPAVSTAITVLTTNTNTSANATSLLTAPKTFTVGSNVNAPISTSSISKPVGGDSPFSSDAKLNNSFNFIVPFTSVPITTPIMFGTSTSSTTVTKPTATSIATATNSVQSLSSGKATEIFGGLTNTPFAFNTTTKSSTNEATTISSSGGVPSASFNINENLTVSSAPTFGTNTCPTMKMLPTSSEFLFNSDRKNIILSSSDQNIHEAANKTENNAFNSNTSMLFGSQAFNTKTSEGRSATIFGNTTKSSENIFNSSSTAQIFGSSSVKPGTQRFTSAASGTPTIFGSNSSKNNASTTFSFGSKSVTSPTTITNNDSTAAPGGFSFSSAVANTTGSDTFGFGCKSSGIGETLNNTYSGSHDSTSQNKTFTFGSSTNKSDNSANIFGGAVNKQTGNASPGGFSFGSATSIKATTFTFGAGNNSSGNAVASASNPSMGFTFGTPAALKPKEILTEKTFSFGSPHTQKQIQSVPASNADTLNIFGLSGATTISQPPAFNFNSRNSTNLQSNSPMINNIFTPHSSNITTGPGDRPIRRATRRLQK